MITLTSASPGPEERQRVIDVIRNTLADGRCVCVEPFGLQGSYEWTLDVLSQLRGHPEASVEWHGRNFTLTFPALLNEFPPSDARARRDGRREEKIGSGEYTSFGTISDFFAKSQQVEECINLLDIPLLQGERPWIIE